MNLSGFAAASIIFFMPLIPTIDGCSTAQSQAITPRGVYSSTYVAQVMSPKYGEKELKAMLQNFSNMASRPVVRFEGTSVDRPIIIQDHHFSREENLAYLHKGTTDSEGRRVIGLAFSDAMFCNIFIADDMRDSETIRETLVHEYLHCYGYAHTPPELRHDIMNAVEDLPVAEDNFVKYAKELEVLIYGK